MTRLELLQAWAVEADIAGAAPTTTISQTKDLLRGVEWIDDAYKELQASKATWRFRRADKTITCVSGTASYTDATVAIWLTDDARIYLTAADENRIAYVPWTMFRETYQIASTRTQTGRPTIFSVKPDNKIIFWPIPDAAYTGVLEAYTVPDAMALDADEPEFPARFHKILVWKALSHYGAWSAEPDKVAKGEREYRAMYFKLQIDQLERIHYGEPLV